MPLAAVLGTLLAAATPAGAADLDVMSLENLLDIGIVGAAKYQQRQSEVAAAVAVITREEIRAFGWRNLAEALNSLPGVYTTYDRQYTYLGLRGFGLPGDYNTRVLLTVNGNRVNEVVYDGALFGSDFPLPLDLIQHIEFIPGPGGAVHGQNAMFGVVNVVTRTGVGLDGGELSAAWQHPQSTLDGRVSWGRLLDNGADLLLSAAATHARGEDLSMRYPGAGPGGIDVSGTAKGMDGIRNKQFFARLGQGAWTLDLLYGDRKKEDPTAAFFSDPLVAGQYQRDYGYRLQLGYQGLSDASGLEVSARLFAGGGYYEGLLVYGGAPNRSTGEGEWVGGEACMIYSGLSGHKLMLGVEAQRNYRIEQIEDDLTLPGQETSLRGSNYRAGVYVQDEWRITEALTATLGLRLDHVERDGNALSPRLALVWRSTPDTTLRALYGRAHRAPNAYERDFEDGVTQLANPALRGETVNTVELVADTRVSGDMFVRASL